MVGGSIVYPLVLVLLALLLAFAWWMDKRAHPTHRTGRILLGGVIMVCVVVVVVYQVLKRHLP